MVNRIEKYYNINHVPYLARHEVELRRGLSPCGDFKGVKGIEDFIGKEVMVIYIKPSGQVASVSDVLRSFQVTPRNINHNHVINIITLYLRKTGRVQILDGQKEDLKIVPEAHGVGKSVRALN